MLIKSPTSPTEFLGVVTDRGALTWFASQAQKDSTFLRYLSNTLSSLPLPSLYLYSSVVAVTAASTVLDAMSLMSEEGVSSVAVTVGEDDRLLSAISVTDIAKVGRFRIDSPTHYNDVASRSSSHLKTARFSPCPFNTLCQGSRCGRQCLWRVGVPEVLIPGTRRRHGRRGQIPRYGEVPGCGRQLLTVHTVYSVLPSNSLAYTIEKLLASTYRLPCTTMGLIFYS